MTTEEKIRYISSLLYKSRTQESTDEEISELNEWIEESEQNKLLFEKLNKREYLEDSYNRYSNLDTTDDWEQLQKKINKSRSIGLHLRKVVSYAAVLAVIVSSAYFIYKYMPEQKQEIVRESNIIAPGSKRAILTFADGQRIILDELESKENQKLKEKSISVESNKLLYKSEEEVSDKKSEIHKISIPRGAEYLLELADGTRVWLNSETELRYPKNFSTKERVVYLKGEAFFKVAKNKNKPFRVITEKSITTVLGTEFNVNNYKENKGVRTTLVEGSVLITNRKSNESIKLRPSEQSKIVGDDISSKQVDVNDYVMWKEGKFYFNKKNLEDIMSQIERWYDVEVFFMEDELMDYLFTGVINKDYEANKIFEIIEKTTNVRFKVKNKTVTIFKKN